LIKLNMTYIIGVLPRIIFIPFNRF
jgi:hypothetical protein